MAWNESLRAARFWAKVEKTDGCWLWRGDHTAAGYGVLRVHRKRQYAHRFVLLLAGRSVGDDQVVMHSCDNPPCVRPDHLVVGSHADNVRDKVAKGRGRSNPALTTHCRKGHELTPENTGTYRQGGATRKRCLICHRASWRRWKDGHLAKDFRQAAVDRLSSGLTLPALDEADPNPRRSDAKEQDHEAL